MAEIWLISLLTFIALLLPRETLPHLSGMGG